MVVADTRKVVGRHTKGGFYYTKGGFYYTKGGFYYTKGGLRPSQLYDRQLVMSPSNRTNNSNITSCDSREEKRLLECG
jgi:hypothetical protein